MEMDMNDTLLTRSQVREWERRDLEIGEQLRGLMEEQREIQRKLTAARIFMPAETEERIDEEPALEAGDENLSQAVIDAVVQLGVVASPMLIRRSIIRENPVLGAKIAASPNYFYTILARHVQKGRLVKDGKVYKLPSRFAQAETEAVAASAPLEPTSQSMEAADDGPKGNGLL
jgi:hypothetical protein